MKRIFTLVTAFIFCLQARTQIVLNELYTEPSSGNHEFFELYNTTGIGGNLSVNDYTIVTFFDISGSKGFYVMDLPNMTISPFGYFVGSSAIPFNFQGVTNSTASDFSWNAAAFTANQGSLKKWVKGGLNVLDGNLNYDQSPIAGGFNDFFYRRTGTGASYTVFMYKNGVLVNTFVGGTGGNTTVTTEIVNMPSLFVDMAGTSTDFTINFSGYASLPLEYCTNDAGSDNGYIREFDGACASWKKSSSSVMHTPRASNGTLSTSSSGTISVASAIAVGNAVTGSTVNYDVVSAPASSFPVQMDVYTDKGTISKVLDAGDGYVATNTETVISQGPFYSTFFPYNANILIVVKTSAGCIDRNVWIPNAILLSVNMVSFEGEQKKDVNTLKWKVQSNETAARFEVQKTMDGTNYTTAGFVLASEKSGEENYEFKETALAGRTIYRLKIYNKSGKVEYSNLVVFQAAGLSSNTLTVVNNPVIHTLSLNYTNNNNSSSKVEIFDMAGHVLQQQSVNMQKGMNNLNIELNGKLNAGNYVVRVSDGLSQSTARFIKQ